MHHRPFLRRRLIDPLLALMLRLNMPAIQRVNYLLSPLQLLLIIPLRRFGERLAGAPLFPVTHESARALFAQGVIPAVQVLATAIAHATLAWLVLAPMLIIGLYRVLEPLFRHLQRAR